MGTLVSKLTVLFEKPFWIGLYEKEDEGSYSVCKITFGAEPKDYEVYYFMLKNWNRLRFASCASTDKNLGRQINPKRLQRIIGKAVEENGMGTKAQQALKLQQQEMKTEKKTFSRSQKEAEKQRKFELHEEKRKQKHRGH